MTPRQHAVLAGVMIFGALGDIALSRGMKDVGHVPLAHVGELVRAIFTPWVGTGIVLLLLFFAAYLAALSFADLTYVLPATAIGYIIMAVMARFFLHENISAQRWAGIVLITVGVGFVTSGPAKTPTARGTQATDRDSAVAPPPSRPPLAGGVSCGGAMGANTLRPPAQIHAGESA